VTALTVGAYFDVQSKGWVGGLGNSIVDAIPFVGTGKGLIELGTGDFISDQCGNCE
jgi:hypothetical protein